MTLKDMWSNNLTERLHASSYALCFLRAWGSKEGAVGGREEGIFWNEGRREGGRGREGGDGV